MAKEGEWLQIGGWSSGDFGKMPIEVRVSTGGEGWSWRKMTDDEKKRLLELWNADQERRRKIAAGECLMLDDFGIQPTA